MLLDRPLFRVKTKGPTCLEPLAFDLMVATDVFAMLGDARDPETFVEILGALDRLHERSDAAVRALRTGSWAEAPGEALAGSVRDVLAAFARCAALMAGGRPRSTELVRDLIALAREAGLEVARSVQSLDDLWRAALIRSHTVRVRSLAAESLLRRRAACDRLAGTERDDEIQSALDEILSACAAAQEHATAFVKRAS
jgi:hypothetical protein